MRYNEIFNKKTLNIFVDASILKLEDIQETVGCPGGLCVMMNTYGVPHTFDAFHCITRHTTNSNSEIKAVLLGVNKALQYRNSFEVINLFSDSKVCIHGLKYWIFNWMNTIRNKRIYNSSKQEVGNQEVFINIINTIMNTNLSINLFHQKGHVTNTNESINHAMEVFKETNKIDYVDRNLIVDLSYYNDYVDIMTKNVLYNTKFTQYNGGINPFNYVPDREHFIKKYKYLINK